MHTTNEHSNALLHRSGSELDEPVWSVISFRGCEATGLTYPDASQKVSGLETLKVAGLCIVTDRAAQRLAS